jgi:hypothetical protein
MTAFGSRHQPANAGGRSERKICHHRYNRIPPYPAAEFPNMKPYMYQNGGDWTWFGGRMIQALIRQGMRKEAYAELDPMINRVLAHNGATEFPQLVQSFRCFVYFPWQDKSLLCNLI